MYCPSCGTESIPGVKYCTRCGGSMAATAQANEPYISPSRATGAVWAVSLATAAIVLIGLAIICVNALDMVRPSAIEPMIGDPRPVASIMIIFGSLTIFGIASMLIRLVSRLLGVHQPMRRLAPFNKPSLSDYAAAQIVAPPKPISSVTEHTTRTFEMEGRERASELDRQAR